MALRPFREAGLSETSDADRRAMRYKLLPELPGPSTLSYGRPNRLAVIFSMQRHPRSSSGGAIYRTASARANRRIRQPISRPEELQTTFNTGGEFCATVKTSEREDSGKRLFFL